MSFRFWRLPQRRRKAEPWCGMLRNCGLRKPTALRLLCEALTRMGARIQAHPDGFVVEGPTPLQGESVASYHDHRLAMALAVAGLVAEGQTTVQDAHCIADSFPGFEDVIAKSGRRYSKVQMGVEVLLALSSIQGR